MTDTKRNITNESGAPLGARLTKAIYRVMNKLDATDCVVNVAKHDRYAELDLFQDNNCIDWGYPVSVNKKED